jgi:hypothetical protein
MEPIGITINEFNKFNNIDDKSEIRPFLNRLFKSGYWNVFKYSLQLEEWLTKQNIDFTIDYDND